MSHSDDKSTATIIGLITLLPAVAWQGLVLLKLWGWFLTPLGVPEPTSIWQAAGIALVCSWASGTTYLATIVKEDESVEGFARIILSFLLPLIMLGFGWIYAALM